MPDPPPYIARISLRDRFLGTGVLVTARLVLTCEHVIRNVGPRASLTLLIDGAHVSGKLKPNAKDAAKDLALIELSADAEAAPPAWSIDIAEGHQCNALGYHGGEYDAVPASVRSAQRQRVDLNQSLIEGCSGGALVMGKGSGKHLTLPSFRIGRFLVTVWEYGKYLDDTRAPKPPARSHLPRARLGCCS